MARPLVKPARKAAKPLAKPARVLARPTARQTASVAAEGRPCPPLPQPTRHKRYWTVELPALDWIVQTSITAWGTEEAARDFAKGRVRNERRCANIWDDKGRFVETLKPKTPPTAELMYKVRRYEEGREYMIYTLDEGKARACAERRANETGIRHDVLIPGNVVVVSFMPSSKALTKKAKGVKAGTGSASSKAPRLLLKKSSKK